MGLRRVGHDWTTFTLLAVKSSNISYLKKCKEQAESESESESCTVLSDSLQPHSPWNSPGDLPKPEIETRTPAFQAESLPAEPQGKTQADCKFPIWSPSISYSWGLLVSVCLSVRRVSLEYQPILNGPLASLTRLRINKSRPWLRSCRGPWISGLGDGWTAVCPQELGQASFIRHHKEWLWSWWCVHSTQKADACGTSAFMHYFPALKIDLF